MRQEGIRLGGEQSGHIVQSDLASTGDGLLTAIQIAYLRHQDGRPLSHMLAPFRRYPQVLLNVRVAKKQDFDTLPAVAAAARDVVQRLGDDGRLVLRYSGTEPLARIMIEGTEQKLIDGMAAELATAIRGELGAG
jgi:phosphoglucosamine mutase